MTHAPMPIQQQPQPVFVKAPSNGLATAAMVLGIVGTVLALIPVIGAFGAFVGGVGIALAIAGLFVARSRGVGKGKAIAGLVLGVASLVVFFAITAATVAAVNSAAKDLNKQIADQTDTSAATDVSDPTELKDAKVASPTKGMFGVAVKVTITNHSSKTSDYSGTVVFESQDGSRQFGTGPLFVEKLRPGQTSVQKVIMLDDLPKGASKVTARLTDFDRTAAF